jgi:hypothetical protein
MTKKSKILPGDVLLPFATLWYYTNSILGDGIVLL